MVMIRDLSTRNRISVTINGKDVDMLIDTGSSINAVTKKMAQALQCDISPLDTNDYTSCTLANGGSERFLGKTKVKFEFPEFKHEAEFLVLPSEAESIILGCQTLTKLKAIIDFPNRCVIFETAVINFISADDNLCAVGESYTNNCVEEDETKSVQGNDSAANDNLEAVTSSIEIDNNDLKASQVEQFKAMLQQRSRVFAQSLKELGKCNLLECNINLKPGTEPIYVRPYKNAWTQREVMEKQCAEWLEAGVIRENRQPQFNFPCVLVPKKGTSKLRMCINFQELNDCVVPEPHPVMTIDEFMCDFGAMKGRIFTVMDLGSAYLQIPLTKQSQEYCTFTVGHKAYSFTRVPFGFVNSGHVFGRAVSRALGDLLHKSVEHFVDDLVVISPNFKQHVKDVAEVLDRLAAAGFTVEPKKSYFCRKSVEYLGYVLEANSVKVNPKNIRKIIDYPTPTKKKDVQTFCGMCVYYRKYIERYSIIMAPMYKLTKADADFVWCDAAEKAFQTMKERLTSAPILAPPDLSSDEPLRVTTDGSSHGTAWVIEQASLDPATGKKALRTVCYGSKTVTLAESKYHSTDLELLALVNCFKANQIMLKSKPFLVFTDNRSLVYLVKKNLDEVKAVTARRLLYIKQFQFTITHVCGKQNHSDALSRHPGDDDEDPLVVRRDDAPYVFQVDVAENLLQQKEGNGNEVMISLEEISKEQAKDEFMRAMVYYLEKGLKEPNGKKDLKVDEKAIDYMLDSGVLYNVRHMRNQIEPSVRVCIPKTLVPKVLHCAHTHVLSGHLGVHSTLARLHNRYYWPNQNTDVANYVKSCKVCAATKPGLHAKAPLIPLPVSKGPFRVLHIDTLKLHTPSNGHHHILTIVDSFSKLLITKALKNKSALSVAKALMECVFQRYGCMAEEMVVISDNAKELTLSYSKALYQLMGVKNITITPFTPSSNGQAEIFNKKILSVLRAYTATYPKAWSQYLPLVTMAINSSQNATGYTAYQMIHGLEVRDVMDLHIETMPDGGSRTHEQAHQYWHMQLCKMRELAKFRLEKTKVMQKTAYDTRAKDRQFSVGDQVYVLNTQLDLEGDTKLRELYLGPYEIVSFVSPVNVKLRDCNNGRLLPRSIHVNKVKMFLPGDVRERAVQHHNDQLTDVLPVVKRAARRPASDDEPTRRQTRKKASDDSRDDTAVGKRQRMAKTPAPGVSVPRYQNVRLSARVPQPQLVPADGLAEADDDPEWADDDPGQMGSGSDGEPERHAQPQRRDVRPVGTKVGEEIGEDVGEEIGEDVGEETGEVVGEDGGHIQTPEAAANLAAEVVSDQDPEPADVPDIDVRDMADEASDGEDAEGAGHQPADVMYPVDRVLRVRHGPGGDNEYYVKYKGYSKKHNQWVKSADMSPQLVEKATRLKLPRANPRE